MAGRILNIEFPTVEPTGATSASGENIPSNSNMFGGFGAKAAEELGGGLEKVSTATADLTKFWGEVQVDDASNAYMRSANGVLDKFRSLRGAEALDAQADTTKALDDLAATHRKTLSSPPQQYQFDGIVRNFQNRYASGIVSTHATAEAHAHANATNLNAFDLALNSTANVAEDPDKVEFFRHEARNALVRQVQAEGNGGDETIVNGAIAKADRAVYKTAAEAIGAKNPDAALRFVEQHRTELGDQFDNTYGAMRDRAESQKGSAIAAQKVSQARGGSFAPSTNSAISNVATRYGINPTDLTRAVQIESGGNPRAQTGSYKGMLQLSESEFEKFKPRPDASIWNPVDNLGAGAAKMKAEGDQFARNFGRQPTGFDGYMIHQQGLAGYSAHLANPEAPAWQNMLSTGEGRQKGERWAKSAIWGNIPDQFKTTFGNVDNVTSRDFVAMWAAKFGGGAAPTFAPTGGINGSAPSGAPMFAPAPPTNMFEGSIVSVGLNEGRGNFETAAFPVGNMAVSIRPNVIQQVLDDPEAQANPKVMAHALASANQILSAQEIAENQSTKLRKEVSDQAAGGYVTSMFDMLHTPGPDYVALAGKINHDPNLEWRTKQGLMDRLKRLSGEEQALSFGPGYLSAREGLFSGPDAPGHIADLSSLVTRTDITTAGLADLQHRWQIAKGSMDKGATEKIVNSFLTYAKKQLSFEEDNGFIKIRDPKGEAIFNSEFVPLFVRRVSDLQTDAEKTGDHSKLDKFLTRENVGKMVQSFRNPGEMAADKIAATGQTGGEPEPPNLPLPAAPEGIDANGWRGVVANPPNTPQGRMTHTNWAGALTTLAGNPTPQVKAAFNKWYGGAGLDADQALRKMGINPEAAALAAGGKSEAGPPLDHNAHAAWRDGSTPVGQEQRFPADRPPVSSVTPPAPAASGTGQAPTAERRVAVAQEQAMENMRARAEGREPRSIPVETAEEVAARATRQRAEADETARTMREGFGGIARAEPEVHRRMMEGERKGLQAELAELDKNEKEARESKTGISELGRRAIERQRARLKARLEALP